MMPWARYETDAQRLRRGRLYPVLADIRAHVDPFSVPHDGPNDIDNVRTGLSGNRSLAAWVPEEIICDL